MYVQRLIPAAAILFGAALLFAEQPAEDSEAVNRAIEDLDSDNFAVRAAATQTLQNMGGPAIAPLTAAALEGPLETTDRAVQILTSYYRFTDEAVLDELDTALERLADSDRPSAVRRANAAINRHEAGREKRTIKRLKQLKALFPPSVNPIGEHNSSTGPRSIWIDSQWQGGDTELRLFRRLKGFGQLNRVRHQLYRVEGCPASLEAVRKLEQIIPNFQVQERGAACLGLGEGNPQKRGFRIHKVSEGGSIQAAGLKVNDVIIGYAGQQVDNFFQLVELIKKNKVGETVKVEYIRFGEVHTADVKLKSWREVFNEEAARKRRMTEQSPAPGQFPVPRPTKKPQPAK